MINNTKKLLLINPWQTYRKDLESEYQSYLPYGLACIGSIGINKGFETKIVDCLEDDTRAEFDEFIRFGKTNDELYSLITDFAPNIVGISSTFSMFENDATEIAKLVKSINPKIIVILGGVTATIEEIYEPLLLNEHCYDIMCRGEGEKTFAELLENYNPSNGEIENLPEIKGISYTNNNMVFKNEDRPFIQDLDCLPFPALHLLDLDKTFNNKYYSRWRNNPIGKRCVPIFTSRGCPYQCCFCSVHSQVGYSFRAYSIDYVISLMKRCIEKYNITHFHFEDDNLTFDICRAKSLFRQMAKLNITWDTPNGVRADKIDEEMIQLMINSGITSISIAAESGNEEVRTKIIRKNLKTKNIIDTVRLCDKYDLPCIVFFVLGFPGETIKDIKETISFSKNITMAYHTINMMYIANPLPGTDLNKNSLDRGYIKKALTNSDYFVAIRVNQASIIETDEFNKKMICDILQKELDSTVFSIHNSSLPMFWIDNPIANSRAKCVFPKMSNRKVEWRWLGD